MWGPKNQHANTTKNAWVDMQQEVIYGAIVELQPDTGKRRIIFYFDDPSDASDGFITSIIEEGSLMEVGKDRKTVRVIIDDVLNYLIMGVGMEQREPSIGEALYIDYVQLYTE